jgi:hypothetical protein
MKSIYRLLFVAGMAISFNANAWVFIWLPVGAIADALSGAEGTNCVAESIKVGDAVNSNGQRMKVKSLSGTSSRCTDSSKPIRALLEPDDSPASPQQTTEAKMDFSDGWVQKEVPSNLRALGTLLMASNETFATTLSIFATKRSAITDTASFVKTRLNIQMSNLTEATQTETTEMVINGARVWQAEVTGTLKSGPKLQYTFMLTFFEGAAEIVLVNAYAPSTVFPNGKANVQRVLGTLTGLMPMSQAVSYTSTSAVKGALSPPSQAPLLTSEGSMLFHSGAQVQQTDRRVALVIGNASYKDAPLRNSVNDAKDVAATLKGLGFQVILRINSDRRQMVEAVREFGGSIKRGGVGLFYYAGHGVQSRGKNFLMPVGARVEGEGDLEFEAMDANMVMAQMDEAANRVNIIVLDACRDNPYTRSFRSTNKGLAQMDSVKGSFIAYATAPGSVAADGTGRNGTYTKHLLTSLRQPDTKIEEVFKRVRLEVARETGNKQIPWDSSSLLVDFYFSVPGIKVASQSNPVIQPQLIPPQLEEKTLNLAGVWRGQFRGTEVVFSIVQDGAAVSLTRISPPAIGQRYAGTINGNTSDVVIYMNDVAIATSRISVLEDRSLRMTVMDCFNVPGYTCAPKGSVLDLKR